MDCTSRGLDSLPILDRLVAPKLASVLMNSNNITLLDEQVLYTWDSLEYIDLRANPLPCSELEKVKDGVEILTDCIFPTKGKPSFIFTFILVGLYPVYSTQIFRIQLS